MVAGYVIGFVPDFCQVFLDKYVRKLRDQLCSGLLPSLSGEYGRKLRDQLCSGHLPSFLDKPGRKLRDQLCPGRLPTSSAQVW